MISFLNTPFESLRKNSKIKYLPWLLAVLTGTLLPLGFAPFHIPGAAILGIALFYTQIQKTTRKKAFLLGWLFGLGFLGVGISWVNISVHTYGHLNLLVSAGITTLLIFYLALFPGLCAFAFHCLRQPQTSTLQNCLLFSSLWCLSEYLRATVFTGFPWLLIGFGQIDTPLKYLMPIVGVYGVGFLTILAACCLAQAVNNHKFYVSWLIAFVVILILPSGLSTIHWSRVDNQPISIGIIQANLSMRDKWDERLFWNIIDHYNTHITALMGKHLIVLPESAIPLPASYVHEFLNDIDQQAQKAGTAVLMGIPEEANHEQTYFYNTLTTLGLASGSYRKQHLVPFGEYIPHPLIHLLQWLNLDMSNMQEGQIGQPLTLAHQHPFATLICYELAYPQLLRQQLPAAQWIVSLSDDGWFGHSLALYQHLQIAQSLSLLTARYQIVANNDGLSSIITSQGHISHELPAFSAGILEGTIYAATGNTPWVKWGDRPILSLAMLIILSMFLQKFIHCFRKDKAH
ncbi:MAG: apolipoprotein N-acyltransferase [Legionella sp.]|nr:MAG: apolipoprotein N-acyltransferase [Legionella sp.]